MGDFADQDQQFETYADEATGKPRWRHTESGRTGWIIRGGSDTMGAETPPADASTPSDPAPAAPAADPTPTPSQEADPYEGWDVEKFKAEHAKLKGENVKYKERFRPYEQAFDGIDPAVASSLGQWSRMIMSSVPAERAEARAWMERQLEGLSPKEAAAVKEAAGAAVEAAGGDEDDFDPYDRKTVEALADERAAAAVKAALDERDQREAQERSIADLRKDFDAEAESLAKELKFPELADQKSWQAERMWAIAAKGDSSVPWKENLRAAAEQVMADIAKASQEYIKRKSAEADAPAATPEGGAPSGSRTPKTREEARKSAIERLGKLGVGQSGQ